MKKMQNPTTNGVALLALRRCECRFAVCDLLCPADTFFARNLRCRTARIAHITMASPSPSRRGDLRTCIEGALPERTGSPVWPTTVRARPAVTAKTGRRIGPILPRPLWAVGSAPHVISLIVPGGKRPLLPPAEFEQVAVPSRPGPRV